jgi:hypothetical protein
MSPDITIDFSVQSSPRDIEVTFRYSKNWSCHDTSWRHLLTIQNWLEENNITYVVSFLSTSCIRMAIECEDARTLIKLTFPEHEPLVQSW